MKDTQPALKLATSFLTRYEHIWVVPKDRSYTADEYYRHYAHIMDMCDASTNISMLMVPFAFKGDALKEYNAYFCDEAHQGTYHNASVVIRKVYKRLETPEFKILNLNL